LRQIDPATRKKHLGSSFSCSSRKAIDECYVTHPPHGGKQENNFDIFTVIFHRL